ncbi:MAG: ribbon-helix-helix protein, CopG family [Candidatus Thalassarchaeaceae archaeon]|jgi:Arc/MetJ-type ribon-helix-helix transcriptional regulator|nr:ribbon-helix-helix protein, CopG family [Candidatus Thalassarchaeaceae archaeon]
MSTSQMTSLRVPEDHLLAMDQRIGFEGMRNRSDVIRAAISHYLESTPTNAYVRSLTLDIGTQTRRELAILNELKGIRPEDAARAGLELYIASVREEMLRSKELEDFAAEMREKTGTHEDHTA